MKSFRPKFIAKQQARLIPQLNNNQALKLIPLGGVGDVTKNMYVYEYGGDIIIIDSGV